jgi:hypothetical protein
LEERMKDRQRIALYSVLASVPLLFIPIVDGGKLGRLCVWFAYAVMGHLLTSLDDFIDHALFPIIVIVGHIGLSLLIGIGLNWLTNALEQRKTSNKKVDHISKGSNTSL